jgi:hypothetical protein
MVQIELGWDAKVPGTSTNETLDQHPKLLGA